jgi:heptosyltransferase-2
LICPHQSLRSQLMSFKIKAHQKTSFKNFYNFLIFTDLVHKPTELPEALRNLSLLGSVYPEIKNTFADYLQKPERIEESVVTLTKEQMSEFGLKVNSQLNRIRSMQAVDETTSMEIQHFFDVRQQKPVQISRVVQNILKIGKGRKVFVIAPGSVWATKMWRTEYYKDLCLKLCRENFVILIGGVDERKLCSTLSEGHEFVYNAAGETSLWESAELLASADQVLTNDSGAMHLASLSGVPTLSIFGPTVLEQGYRPWNNQARTIESDIYCRPCGRHGARKCPLGNHACMKLVTSDNVLKEITQDTTHLNNPSH